MISVISLRLRRQPRSTLFPYTTLFRSLTLRIWRLLRANAQYDKRPRMLAENSRNGDAHRSAPCRAYSYGRRYPEGRFCRSEEHTSELQSHVNLVCRLLLEKKKRITQST